ncbi:MAG: tRNA dihydrouridine(20/20a) synthase DusA [Methylotetracoccus sp.]|jgi:tRNA-dihydrouridine synthase A|nr:tRNA dihydrouridine(20/20a) synthase DusA [Methylotetracoccus sp.]
MNDTAASAVPNPDRKLSVAPMLDRTDRHFRYFARLLTKQTLFYTEMVTTAALIHGDAARLLEFNPAEKPLALQLGGSDPAELVKCVRLAAPIGFDEFNLNIGCPSPRVQKGRFGACLMAEPELVADCVSAMSEATAVPVTVKMRIGVDDRDSYDHLCHFVAKVADAGCRTFIVHARKAWLQGLSPRENREIPPLRYDIVADLKRDFPGLEIILNGGVQSLEEVERHLRTFDGVMIGRAAYQNPYLLAAADPAIFGERRLPISRQACIESWLPYVEAELSAGTGLYAMVRHALGLFYGVAGGRRWRRVLSEHAVKAGAGAATIRQALEACSA